MTEVDLSSPDVKEKIKQLRDKLGLDNESTIETATEGADYSAPELDQSPSPITGKDVNWDDYETIENLRHLYPKAELRETEDGLKWTVELFEFYSASKTYNGDGVGKDGTPKQLGDYLTFMVNGPEKWQIASILPNGSGLGAVVFQRKSRMVLPDPIPLKNQEIEAPTDEELKEYEDTAIEWAGGNDGKPVDDGKSREEIPAS